MATSWTQGLGTLFDLLVCQHRQLESTGTGDLLIGRCFLWSDGDNNENKTRLFVSSHLYEASCRWRPKFLVQFLLRSLFAWKHDFQPEREWTTKTDIQFYNCSCIKRCRNGHLPWRCRRAAAGQDWHCNDLQFGHYVSPELPRRSIQLRIIDFKVGILRCSHCIYHIF